ncbi:hypothetical protein FY557_17270 [Chryseobacterium sp. SN22]|uniref:hypothetical protein n=1 Tax=Chryseobacterium sp. SN22 TaxID=2606431 RepID=UPI0011ED44CC|nr:hypothetical protein [Chryseobacterium sp. SN22]KAA0126401.1 hypothetical protein FY557_17270 [Chryseobacterium sp. SN22]
MLNLQKENKVKYSTLSTLGSALVLFSATFPFINNFIALPFPKINTIHVSAANNNLAAVLWSLAICFQATLLIIANYLKPYLISYAPALFASLYSSSFYFLPLLGYVPNENVWFFIALISIVLVILSVMYYTSLYLQMMKEREKLLIESVTGVINQ